MRNPITSLWRFATTRRKTAPKSPATTPRPPQRGKLTAAGDFLVLAVAVVVTMAVGAAAGYISFSHFVALAVSLGEPGGQAFLFPAAAEGMVIMAGLVMLYCSRKDLPVPLLVWACMAFGVGVALVVNIVHGMARGTGAAALAALAPIAFLGSYELLMRLIRLVREAAMHAAAPAVEHVCPAPEPVELRVEVPVEKVVERRVEVPVERVVEKRVEVATPVVPTDAYDAARIAYEHSATGPGRALGQRALVRKFGIERSEAEEIIKTSQEALAEAAEQPSVTAPAETVFTAWAESLRDRHSAAAEQAPNAPTDAPTGEAPVTVPSTPAEATQNRHSTAAGQPSDATPDADANPASPATVTISDEGQDGAQNRPSAAAGRASQTPADAPTGDAPVTVPDAPAEAVTVPPQAAPPAPPTKLLRDPLDGQPVAALNGARSTVTGADGDDL